VISNKKVLAVIPARGGSKGLPGKNLSKVAGRSLIELAIEAARECREIDKIVVSTDSAEIATASMEAGVRVERLRPPRLSRDETSAVSVAHFVLDEEKESGFDADVLVWLEPTSPLRRSSDISKMLGLLESHAEAEAVVSIAQLRHDPTVFRVFEDQWLVGFDPGLPLIERRQESREVWFPFGVAYVCRVEAFREQSTFYPSKTLGYEIERFQEFEIDDLIDLVAADAILKWKSGNE